MEMIDSLIFQIIEGGMNWLASVWWYWVPVGLGFLFRFVLLTYKVFNPKKRVKIILRDIGIIIFLTVAWMRIEAGGQEDSVVVMILILTLIYVFYGLVDQCAETGGTTESILLIVKSLFVTMLSFQSLAGTIFGATITTVLAVLAYKYWFSKESKTDLFEIIFLCAESIILSIYGSIVGIEGIGVLLFVVFEETAIFAFNYVVVYIAAVRFGEAEWD